MRQLKITKSMTNRDSLSLEKYLQEIGKEGFVTAEEEAVLAKKIREGDQAALDKLTRANLRFVVSVAKQYQNQGISLPDLINEGNLGLIKACKRFDETRGFKLISYAVWWIRQSIISAVADQSRIVRLPLNQVGAMSKIRRASSRLEQEFEREPTIEEVSEILEMEEDKVSDAMRVSGRHISIDAPFVIGEEHSLLDVLENDDVPQADENLIREGLRYELDRSLNTLSKQESQAIRLRYRFDNSPGENRSNSEVGEIMEIGGERARQI